MAIAIRGKNFMEFRFDPLSKKNRVRFDYGRARITKEQVKEPFPGKAGDPQRFINKVLREPETIFTENKINRRGSLDSVVRLEYIFWRIRNDPYVN